MGIRSTKVLKQGEIKKFKQYGNRWPLIAFQSRGFAATGKAAPPIDVAFDQQMRATEAQHNGAISIRPRQS